MSETGLYGLISRTGTWHIAGFSGPGLETVRAACGANTEPQRPWALDVLLEPLCRNCCRICGLVPA